MNESNPFEKTFFRRTAIRRYELQFLFYTVESIFCTRLYKFKILQFPNDNRKSDYPYFFVIIFRLFFC
jgi:hypothetical protein